MRPLLGSPCARPATARHAFSPPPLLPLLGAGGRPCPGPARPSRPSPAPPPPPHPQELAALAESDRVEAVPQLAHALELVAHLLNLLAV
jgi:hypothetical protein